MQTNLYEKTVTRKANRKLLNCLHEKLFEGMLKLHYGKGERWGSKPSRFTAEHSQGKLVLR